MENQSNNADTLLVIGNGFDLHCGLKSTFRNYFDYSIENVDFSDIKIFNETANLVEKDFASKKGQFGDDPLRNRILSDLIKKNMNDNENMDDNTKEYTKKYCESLTAYNEFNNSPFEDKENMNFWLFFFWLRKNEKVNNWSDVEQAITEFFTKESILEDFKGFIAYANSFVSRHSFRDDIQSQTKAKLDKYSSKLGPEKKKLLYYLVNCDSFSISDDITEALLKELSKFEKDFGTYIENRCTKKDYKDNCLEVLKTLCSSSQNINILSFNYTNPFSEKADQQNLIVKNVHSTFKDPIIGIDSTDVDPSDPFVCFTKAYRIMRLARKDNSSPILSKRIKNVIFFGHSLAAADYSYFQAIFDYLNIYSGPVTLTFCYCDYKDNEKQVAREQYDRIYKLMSKYGDTFPPHGQNLLHKMLLEKRIFIKKVPSLNKDKQDTNVSHDQDSKK